MHRPADEGPVETFRRNPDYGVRHAIHHLRLAYDLRIAAKPVFPHLIADHHHRMSVAPIIFVRREAASQQWANAERVKVICGNDAARSINGALADAESGSRDSVDNEPVK